MTMLSATRQVLARQAAVRQYSRSAVAAEPKLHKATGNWEALVAKRPIDQDDQHVSRSLAGGSH